MRTIAEQRQRWPRRLATVLLAVIGATIFSAVPASAHNVLISSTPAAGALLAHTPASITLVFDQDVQNVYAEMAITVGSQPPVEFTPQIDGPDVTATLAAEHLTIPPASSGPTAWRIGYRIVSADGHPVSGLVNFSVGTAATSKDALADPAQDRQASSSPPWLLIIGVAAVVAAALAAGVIVLRRRRSTAA